MVFLSHEHVVVFCLGVSAYLLLTATLIEGFLSLEYRLLKATTNTAIGEPLFVVYPVGNGDHNFRLDSLLHGARVNALAMRADLRRLRLLLVRTLARNTRECHRGAEV